jgi:hypothetical protein
VRQARPLLAALLSGLFPGLGQLYNRDVVRAGLFVAGAAILLWGPVTIGIPLEAREPPARRLGKILLESAPFLVLTIASAVDAYRGARRAASGGDRPQP